MSRLLVSVPTEALYQAILASRQDVNLSCGI